MKASEASCSASRASAVQRYGSTETVFPISLTSLAKGSLRSSRSVVFWYFRISISALVPGLYLLLFAPEDPLALVPGAELGPPCAFEKTTRKRSKESCQVRSSGELSERQQEKESTLSSSLLLRFSSFPWIPALPVRCFSSFSPWPPLRPRHSRSFGLSSETVIRATGSPVVWCSGRMHTNALNSLAPLVPSRSRRRRQRTSTVP